MSSTAFEFLAETVRRSHLRVVRDEAREAEVNAETERLADSMAEAFEIAERQGRFHRYLEGRNLDPTGQLSRRRHTFYLQSTLGQRLARFVKRTGRNPTEILNEALADFLDDAGFER